MKGFDSLDKDSSSGQANINPLPTVASAVTSTLKSRCSFDGILTFLIDHSLNVVVIYHTLSRACLLCLLLHHGRLIPRMIDLGILFHNRFLETPIPLVSLNDVRFTLRL
jgi:hypothetical protein